MVLMLRLMLFFGVFTVLVSTSLFTIHRSASLDGNELEQFYRFENLTKQYGLFLTHGNDCLNVDHGTDADRSKRTHCLYKLFDERSSNFTMKKLWDRKMESFTYLTGSNKNVVTNRTVQDCEYNVTLGNILYNIEKGLLVELVIQQSDCTSKATISGNILY